MTRVTHLIFRGFLLALALFFSLAGCTQMGFYSVLGDKLVVDTLSVGPTNVTVQPGGTITFVATGGNPPYAFSIASVGSAPPAPTLTTAGVYVAGSTKGTDTIEVTDASGTVAAATVSVTSAVTNVDYTVTAASFPTTGTSGNTIPAGSTFILSNAGSAGGTKPVSWWVYMSTSSTLGSGASVLTSGTTAALGPGATSSVNVSWTWPAGSGTRYLFVMVAAADDLNQANNTFSVPATVALNPSQVDYVVPTVTGPGGSAAAGSAVSGTFQFRNAGTNNGGQNVTWSVFASMDNVLDASDVLVASGSYGSALNAGVTSSVVTFNGNWPSASANYYLIVHVAAADDLDPLNNSGVSASQTAVGLNEAPSSPHDSALLTNAFNLGVTLQPGMTVSMAGSVLSSESDDIIAFDSGTASTITFTMIWTGSFDVQHSIMTAPSTYLSGSGVVGGSSLSWTWTVDAANTPRWLDIKNPLLANVGAYSLVISAN